MMVKSVETTNLFTSRGGRVSIFTQGLSSKQIRRPVMRTHFWVVQSVRFPLSLPARSPGHYCMQAIKAWPFHS
jgi:hypothetical protein